MTKWTSPLFTDMRNKIADSVVFSRWKGRGYFRSWVKPANPRTNPQKAHRAVLANLVKRYQEITGTEGVKSAWNARALEYLISGYNLFVKWGRSSYVKAEPGAASGELKITYKCGIPLSEARIYTFNASEGWSDDTPAEGLSSGENTITITKTAGTEYEVFLATKNVLREGDSSPQFYQAITKWYPDTTNGVAVEAKATTPA